ncbi:hypothetical protein BCV72DRAFT_227046 [Rhizopus microsporus var. microsporus]|uniref:Uncharacterized protein n=1 Tax=Rhizopus microsporus var. microsporus TaxID=86635 RepID=A0A1X0R5E6_RHIZD|nr:hypothetical protein BCV72DRAFT_227046 [Rhizopus microsporus var. microsporus]
MKHAATLVKRATTSCQIYRKIRKRKARVLLLKKIYKKKYTWPAFNLHDKTELKYKGTTTLEEKRVTRVSGSINKEYELVEWDPTVTIDDLRHNCEHDTSKDEHMNHTAYNMIQDYVALHCKQNIGLITDLVLQLIDQLLENMANIHESQNGKIMEWEYVLMHAIQIGVPQSVIEQTRIEMETKTNRTAPAIEAFNKEKEQLIDLTKIEENFTDLTEIEE